MHCLSERLKSTFFEKIFERSGPEGAASGVRKKFQKHRF